MLAAEGPLVILTGDDCVTLGPQLRRAIQLAWIARGDRTPPRALVEFSGAVNTAARCRAGALASAGHGTAADRARTVLPVSDQPDKLSIREAATLAQVSETLMRSAARRGDVAASRGHRGAWAVDLASLAAWITSRRRTGNDRQAA